MKKSWKYLFVIFAISIFFMIGVPAHAVSTNCTIYTGSNVNSQDYIKYGKAINSYLIVTENAQYMRFQADAMSDSYLAEYYDSHFDLQKTIEIAKELSSFGAFYDDGSNYYILSGQSNLSEDDTVEVYRLTKYDHDWNRLGTASLYGANTYVPFNSGSARITHDGSLLFIRTCHTMYKTSDGLHHQANVTIEVDTANMEVVDSYYIVMNISYGYVSHSFNQFIKLDNGHIIGVDHGDAYPRSIVLTKYTSAYTSSGFSKSCNSVDMLSISGSTGSNYTGVSLGGFEIGEDNYLVAGNTVSMGDDYDANGTRNIFVSAVNHSLSGDPVVNYITSYEEGDTSPSTPHFVKTGTNMFLLLWMKDGVLNYCQIDGDGNISGSIHTMEGALSDCVPVLKDKTLVWYTWKNENLNFYSIDIDNLSSSKVEIENGHNYDYTNATKDSNIATKKCSVCGYEETFTTIDNFYISTSSGSSVTEGTSTNVYFYSVSPSAADNKEFIVTSSDENVAAVNGTEITFVGAGTVTITATAKYRPSVTAQMTIKVSHNYSAEILKEATCSEEGQKQYTCSVCGASYTEPIAKLAHTFETKTVKAATCSEEGEKQCICSVCGYSCTEAIAKPEHTYDSCINATEDDNTAYRLCSVCGYKEAFSTMNSFAVRWWNNGSGGNISSTQFEQTSYEVRIRYYDPDEVDNTDFVITSSDEDVAKPDGTNITFASPGTAKVTIYAKYRPSVKLEYTFTVTHDYDIETLKEATCSEEGERKYTCSICGATYTRVLDKLNHSYEITNTKEATCLEEGQTQYTCSVCGYSYTETIAKLEHSYAEYVWAATCTKPGSKTFVCSRCGYTETEQIDPFGHLVVIDPYVAPTNTETGLTEGSHCAICGTVIQSQNVIPALTTINNELGNDSISQENITLGNIIQDKSNLIGKSVEMTDNIITATKSDEISGTVYQLLQLKVKSIGSSSLKIQWKKAADAISYIIYGAKCGSTFKKLGTTYTTYYLQNALKKGKYYKYFVIAVKDNTVIATSKTIHIATSGGKVGNDKSIKLNKSALSIKKSKKFKLKATVKPYSKKLIVKRHRSVCYESSNPSIAAVSSKGVVTGKKKGVCYIYAYAQDGICKSIKVTVK